MSPRNTRLLLRIVHIALGVCLAFVIYAPTSWTEPLRLLLGGVVVPLVLFSGLAMWQQGRLRRMLTRMRTPKRDQHAASDA